MVAVRFQTENRHPDQRVFETSAQRFPGVCILKLLLLAKVLIRKRPNWRFLKDLKTVLMPRKPFKNPIFKSRNKRNCKSTPGFRALLL